MNLTLDLDPWPYISPPTIAQYAFEQFNALSWRRWMWTNWRLATLTTSTFYVLAILWGQRIMRTRQPLSLQVPLLIWNFILALFSLIGFIRTFPELFQVVSGPSGFYRSICVRDNLNPSSIFWAFLFTWSKILELGDTLFLVLRKRTVIFLHWYHHITVLIISWATYADYDPILRWFGVVNMLVHFYMYSYFFLKAMGVRLWKSVSITVTMFQLSQMVLGILVNCYAFWVKRKGVPCTRSERGQNIHLLMYTTYLILFLHYFYKAYIFKKPRMKAN